MERHRGAVAFRVACAALAVAGVITQLRIAIETDFGIVSFFSYFTTLSNLIASVVFVVGAVGIARRRPPTSLGVTVRGAAVVYLAFVGIVFNSLLREADLGDLEPWVNVVHHVVMPIAVVVDWVWWPPRTTIPRRAVAVWMVFPAAYVAYSLVRGEVTGFYAYPFFDPEHVGGYGGVAAYCAVLLVAFVVLALLVRLIGERRGNWGVDPEDGHASHHH